MGRSIGGAIAGVIAWIVFVSLLNLEMRRYWLDYALVEKAMNFTMPMMAARLSISAVSSLGSGAVAGLIDRGRWAALGAGTLLLLMFAPIHYSLWTKFPIWYHATFFVSLPLLSAIGGLLVRARVAAK